MKKRYDDIAISMEEFYEIEAALKAMELLRGFSELAAPPGATIKCPGCMGCEGISNHHDPACPDWDGRYECDVCGRFTFECECPVIEEEEGDDE